MTAPQVAEDKSGHSFNATVQRSCLFELLAVSTQICLCQNLPFITDMSMIPYFAFYWEVLGCKWNQNKKKNFFHFTLSDCCYCINMIALCELRNKPNPSEALAYG